MLTCGDLSIWPPLLDGRASLLAQLRSSVALCFVGSLVCVMNCPLARLRCTACFDVLRRLPTAL